MENAIVARIMANCRPVQLEIVISTNRYIRTVSLTTLNCLLFLSLGLWPGCSEIPTCFLSNCVRLTQFDDGRLPIHFRLFGLYFGGGSVRPGPEVKHILFWSRRFLTDISYKSGEERRAGLRILLV